MLTGKTEGHSVFGKYMWCCLEMYCHISSYCWQNCV